jgi:hypothetical protein
MDVECDSAYHNNLVRARDANSGGEGPASLSLPGGPAPLASRLHRIPTHFRLDLHWI